MVFGVLACEVRVDRGGLGIERREAGSRVLLEQRWFIPANSAKGENQQM